MKLKRYSQTLTQDVLAGVSGAVAGAPQAMGFAIVAGISPIYGLYTAVVSTVIGSLTTSSVYMTVAPTNALALVVGSRLSLYSGDDLVARLFTLTLLVGVFQLAFGLLNFGHLARYVSNAVMTGFITGAGLLIVIGQLPHLFGVEGSDSRAPLLELWHWIEHVPDTQFQTLIIGVLAIVIIFQLHRTKFRGTATLVALVFTALLVTFFGWDNVELVRDMSSVPSGLPALVTPDLDYARNLASAALAIAVLASVQSAAISNAVSQPDGSSANVSHDMGAQGLANIVGSFFQGMPSGGSLSRTAVNVHAGAQTRRANLIAGVLIAVVLVLLGPGVDRIALAGLAGHLMVAASGLIQFDQIHMVWGIHWSARAAMVATFVATLLLPLEYSIYIGVALSVVLHLHTSSQSITVSRLVVTGEHRFREEPVQLDLPEGGTVIFSITGDLYFGAIQHLEELLPPPSCAHNTIVILRLRNVHYLGSTGMRFLQRYDRQLKQHGGKLVLAGVTPPVKTQLDRAGVLAYFGEKNVFYADEVLFSATEEALASNGL